MRVRLQAKLGQVKTEFRRRLHGINPRGAGPDPYGRIGRSIPDVIAAYHEGCSLLSRSSSASV